MFRSLLLAAVLAALLATPAGVSAQEARLHPEGVDAAGRPRYSGVLNLQEALALGLAENLGIALGQAESRRASAETAEAAALGRPKLAVGAAGGGGTAPMIWPAVPGVEPGFLTSLPPEALSLNASLMVPLLNGGLFRHRLEAAEQSERAALARAALTLREAARAIRTGWYRLLHVRLEVEVAEWVLEQQRELVRLSREQLVQGKVARVVLVRAEAEAAAAEQELEGLRADRAEAEADLKVALGVSVTSPLLYEWTSEEPPLAAAEEEDLATALSDRPDLVAARYAVEARDRQVAEALSEFSPQVYAMAMGESMRTGFLRGGSVEGGYQVGLVVAWPLYDGGERQARVDRARAGESASRLELERLEQEATAQVVAARARLQAAERRLALSAAEVAAAAEQMRISHLRFRAGRGIFLEVLDAVSALARARTGRAAAFAEAGTARANLLYATGRY